MYWLATGPLDLRVGQPADIRGPPLRILTWGLPPGLVPKFKGALLEWATVHVRVLLVFLAFGFPGCLDPSDDGDEDGDPQPETASFAATLAAGLPPIVWDVSEQVD